MVINNCLTFGSTLFWFYKLHTTKEVGSSLPKNKKITIIRLFVNPHSNKAVVLNPHPNIPCSTFVLVRRVSHVLEFLRCNRPGVLHQMQQPRILVRKQFVWLSILAQHACPQHLHKHTHKIKASHTCALTVLLP